MGVAKGAGAGEGEDDGTANLDGPFGEGGDAPENDGDGAPNVDGEASPGDSGEAAGVRASCGTRLPHVIMVVSISICLFKVTLCIF